MCRLLLALSFALLPLTLAQAYDFEGKPKKPARATAQASLAKHEHGVANLNAVLDGSTLEIQLESPALNLLGFEHAPSNAAEQAKVAAARRQLEQPQALFALPIEAKCALREQELHSALFGEPAEPAHDEEPGHSDISAHYQFACAAPQALKTLELGSFFGSFPATEKLEVQLIGPSGQQGVQLSPGNTRLTF